MNCIDPGIFAGMTRVQLQQLLVEARAAQAQAMTGSKPVTVSYSQGDGARSVTFSQANQAAMTAWINQLLAALGMRPARRAISFRF